MAGNLVHAIKHYCRHCIVIVHLFPFLYYLHNTGNLFQPGHILAELASPVPESTEQISQSK